jgi:hypothetical protein
MGQREQMLIPATAYQIRMVVPSRDGSPEVARGCFVSLGFLRDLDRRIARGVASPLRPQGLEAGLTMLRRIDARDLDALVQRPGVAPEFAISPAEILGCTATIDMEPAA